MNEKMARTEHGAVSAWSRVRLLRALALGLLLSVVAEGVTLAIRFAGGFTAAEFNRTAPLVVQIHHMFWAVPLVGVAGLLRSRPRLVSWLCAVATACVVSDLAHHFVVLPLVVGETGWHWP